MSDTITTLQGILPSQFNFNTRFSPESEVAPREYHYFTLPQNSPTRERFSGGHTITIDGEEREVPAIIEDYEINAPDSYTYHFSDGFSYWNGTEINAEVIYKYQEHMGHLTSESYWEDDSSFDVELVDDYTLTYHLEEPKNEQMMAFQNARGVSIPLPPEVLDEYYQRLLDMETQEDQQVILEDLAGLSIDFYDAAEIGIGTSPYVYDDITEERVIGELDENHPAADLINIPYHEIKIAEDERSDFLMAGGHVDLFDGIIQKETRGGAMNREVLPDHIEQIDAYQHPAMNKLKINHTNKHLARTKVRQAIVAAVPWTTGAQNGWGPEKSNPMRYHTGMPDPADIEWFDNDFLDTLHQWPMDSDIELATTLMEDAGYTMSGNEWVGPDGEVPRFDIVVPTDFTSWLGMAQTIEAALSSFGIPVDLITVETGSMWDRLLDRGYDLTIMWTRHGTFPGRFYEANSSGFAPSLFDHDLSDARENDVTVGDYGRHFVAEIPSNPDSFRIGGSGETVDLRDEFHTFRDPEATEDEMLKAATKCARWYNYAVPDFQFHQYNDGFAGNTRDFTFHGEGWENKMQHGDRAWRYQLFSGLVQPAYE